MCMNDGFVSDYTFMGVNYGATRVAAVWGQWHHYFILVKGMTVLEKKKKRQTSIYVLLFGLKKGLPIYRISFYKDSSVTQEKINDVIIAGNIN